MNKHELICRIENMLDSIQNEPEQSWMRYQIYDLLYEIMCYLKNSED